LTLKQLAEIIPDDAEDYFHHPVKDTGRWYREAYKANQVARRRQPPRCPPPIVQPTEI
jgi:hypothetical protein